MIMMPMTRPAASALSEATSRPMASPQPRSAGPMVSAAKNPYTTVGTPASTSSSGLAQVRKFGCAYSAR